MKATWNNPHLERLLIRYGSGPARGEYDDLLKERDRLRALADPAPVGLTEDERKAMAKAERMIANRWQNSTVLMDLLRTIHRLSAAPVDDEDGWQELVDAMRAGGRLAAPVDDREPSVTYTSTATRRTTSVPVSPSVDPEEG